MTIKLMKHQEDTLKASANMFAAAWFFETGTGKTILAIENIKYLWEKKAINFAVIVAPKMVCDSVWLNELARYRSVFHHMIFRWVGSINLTEKYIIEDIIKSIENDTANKMILPILIVNIEAFSHVKVYKMMFEILKKTKNIFIVDESTTIKNIKAQRTKGMLKLAELGDYKRILSGFPVLKSPEDLYSQIRFLGHNLIPYGSFYAFRNDFSVLRHMGKYAITIQHKNLDKLANLIKSFSFRVLKKDCLDLPDKIRTKRYVEMTPEQNQIYSNMKRSGFLELKKTNEKVFAVSLLTQIGKLHQIANGLLVQQDMEILNNKYDTLCDVLEDEVPGQCVIWFCYTSSLLCAEQKIKKKFGERSCSIIYGDVAHTTRVERIESFQKGLTRFLLANPSTIMHGINLTNCSFSIYFNNSTNLEHRIQSEDRFHRLGQVNKVTYIDIITQGTVEDKILEKLQQHHKIGADILKDEWEEWFQ